jgi:hypothetical protein
MLLAPATLLAGLSFQPSLHLQSESPKEVHGVWIAAGERDLFSSPAKIAQAMDFLLDAGANVVFVPAWAEGVPFFRSAVLKEALGIELAERDVLEEIAFEAHRVGLEVFPWFEPGIPCPSESDCPLLKKKPELFARDKDGKVVIQRGVANLNLDDASGKDLLRKVVLEVCQNYDIDGVVGAEPVTRLKKEIASVDPGLVVATPAGVELGGSEACVALPVIDAPDPDKGGDHLVGYGKLREKNGELEETLRSGAWAEPALVPWRLGKTWRRRTEALDPAAGEGTWSWAQREGEPQSLVLNGGEHGHATWTFTPKDTGVYSLYVWIPSRADQTARANYRRAAVDGTPALMVDASLVRNHGWMRLGNVRLEARQEIEVARLLAEEDDASKVTAAGPLLPLLNRRAMRP